MRAIPLIPYFQIQITLLISICISFSYSTNPVSLHPTRQSYSARRIRSYFPSINHAYNTSITPFTSKQCLEMDRILVYTSLQLWMFRLYLAIAQKVSITLT